MLSQLEWENHNMKVLEIGREFSKLTFNVKFPERGKQRSTSFRYCRTTSQRNNFYPTVSEPIILLGLQVVTYWRMGEVSQKLNFRTFFINIRRVGQKKSPLSSNCCYYNFGQDLMSPLIFRNFLELMTVIFLILRSLF